VLAVKSRSGEIQACAWRRYAVGRHHKISLSDVKVGSFIGTTNSTGAGRRNNAIEVHVFPEDMRGTGEGSRPFDLRPNSTMDQCHRGRERSSAMTVTPCWSNTRNGEKKVLVTPDTAVVTYVPADKSELKAGAKIIAFFKKLPDGSFEANRVQRRPQRPDAADVTPLVFSSPLPLWRGWLRQRVGAKRRPMINSAKTGEGSVSADRDPSSGADFVHATFSHKGRRKE